MNTETQKWQKQLQLLLLQPKAILKLIGVGIGWHLLGLLLGFSLKMGIFVIFVAVFIGVLWLAPYWYTAYLILYRIIGDKTVPLLTKNEWPKLKWWQYISTGIKLTALSYILYFGIKLLFS